MFNQTAKQLFGYEQVAEADCEYPIVNRYAKGGGQPLVTAGQIKEVVIAIPAMREQERIVSILDRFDTLCNDLSAGLPAEIEARQKQYEYYRDKLLSFKELPK